MTPQQIEAMKLALDLTTMHHTDDGYAALREKVRSASKEALAQPEQDPICPDCKAKVLYECVACSSNNYPPKENA